MKAEKIRVFRPLGEPPRKIGDCLILRHNGGSLQLKLFHLCYARSHYLCYITFAGRVHRSTVCEIAGTCDGLSCRHGIQADETLWEIVDPTEFARCASELHRFFLFLRRLFEDSVRPP